MDNTDFKDDCCVDKNLAHRRLCDISEQTELAELASSAVLREKTSRQFAARTCRLGAEEVLPWSFSNKLCEKLRKIERQNSKLLLPLRGDFSTANNDFRTKYSHYALLDTQPTRYKTCRPDVKPLSITKQRLEFQMNSPKPNTANSVELVEASKVTVNFVESRCKVAPDGKITPDKDVSIEPPKAVPPAKELMNKLELSAEFPKVDAQPIKPSLNSKLPTCRRRVVQKLPLLVGNHWLTANLKTIDLISSQNNLPKEVWFDDKGSAYVSLSAHYSGLAVFK